MSAWRTRLARWRCLLAAAAAAACLLCTPIAAQASIWSTLKSCGKVAIDGVDPDNIYEAGKLIVDHPTCVPFMATPPMWVLTAAITGQYLAADATKAGAGHAYCSEIEGLSGQALDALTNDKLKAILDAWPELKDALGDAIGDLSVVLQMLSCACYAADTGGPQIEGVINDAIDCLGLGDDTPPQPCATGISASSCAQYTYTGGQTCPIPSGNQGICGATTEQDGKYFQAPNSCMSCSAIPGGTSAATCGTDQYGIATVINEGFCTCTGNFIPVFGSQLGDTTNPTALVRCDCPAPYSAYPDGSGATICDCPAGQKNVNGQCQPPPPPPDCAAQGMQLGYHNTNDPWTAYCYNPIPFNANCAFWQASSPNGTCNNVCPDGQVWTDTNSKDSNNFEIFKCLPCASANSCIVDNQCHACLQGTHLDGNNNCVPDAQCPPNTQSKVTVVGTPSAAGGPSCLMFDRTCEPCNDDQASVNGGVCVKLTCQFGQTAKQHACGPTCGAGEVLTLVNDVAQNSPMSSHTSTGMKKTVQCVRCSGNTITAYNDGSGDNSAGACKACPGGTHPDVRNAVCLPNCAKGLHEINGSCVPITIKPPIDERTKRPKQPSREIAKPKKPVGGEVAKPKAPAGGRSTQPKQTLNCPPRMHPNPSGTGCVPNLDIGHEFGSGSSGRGGPPRTGGPGGQIMPPRSSGKP